jgi:hypothetical protein
MAGSQPLAIFSPQHSQLPPIVDRLVDRKQACNSKNLEFAIEPIGDVDGKRSIGEVGQNGNRLWVMAAELEMRLTASNASTLTLRPGKNAFINTALH